MLALKYSHQLSWGELKFIEDPMLAIRTVEMEHGKRIGGKHIQNAHLHDLPDEDDRRYDPYRFIKTKLENGEVFLVNHSTTAPAIIQLDINSDGQPEYDFRHSTNPFFRSAFGAALRHIPIPKPMGVLRDEPKPAQPQQERQKVEREKHVILLNLEGQNDRPLPLKHNITLYVENTTQSTVAVRQLSEVIYNPYSRVFTTEKGDGLKVYAISDGLLEVRKDLNKNKNVTESESKDLIKPLDETGQETRADGATLHHFTYPIANNYIEIELLDEDDEPEAGVQYNILNKLGQTIARGHLDENGYAIVEGIDVDDAEVYFPGVEDDAIYDKAQGDQA
ncbi:hypothetical protein ACU6U9_21715 [Pseudomonas sp. HK3]